MADQQLMVVDDSGDQDMEAEQQVAVPPRPEENRIVVAESKKRKAETNHYASNTKKSAIPANPVSVQLIGGLPPLPPSSVPRNIAPGSSNLPLAVVNPAAQPNAVGFPQQQQPQQQQQQQQDNPLPNAPPQAAPVSFPTFGQAGQSNYWDGKSPITELTPELLQHLLANNVPIETVLDGGAFDKLTTDPRAPFPAREGFKNVVYLLHKASTTGDAADYARFVKVMTIFARSFWPHDNPLTYNQSSDKSRLDFAFTLLSPGQRQIIDLLMKQHQTRMNGQPAPGQPPSAPGQPAPAAQAAQARPPQQQSAQAQEAQQWADALILRANQPNADFEGQQQRFFERFASEYRAHQQQQEQQARQFAQEAGVQATQQASANAEQLARQAVQVVETGLRQQVLPQVGQQIAERYDPQLNALQQRLQQLEQERLKAPHAINKKCSWKM